MDIYTADRNLRIIGNDVSDEEPELNQIEMTQVLDIFSDGEGVDGDTVSDNVFISTQVQGEIDKLKSDYQEKEKFKKLLTEYQYCENINNLYRSTESGGNIHIDKPLVQRRQNRKNIRKKSTVQANDNNLETQLVRNQSKKLISILSGKPKKANNRLSSIYRDIDDNIPIMMKEQFEIHNSDEWDKFLKILKGTLSKKIKHKHYNRYVYYNSSEENEYSDLWLSSQLPPTDIDFNREFMLRNTYSDEVSRVFTLSQLMDESYLKNHDDSLISESTIPDSMESDATVRLEGYVDIKQLNEQKNIENVDTESRKDINKVSNGKISALVQNLDVITTNIPSPTVKFDIFTSPQCSEIVTDKKCFCNGKEMTEDIVRVKIYNDLESIKKLEASSYSYMIKLVNDFEYIHDSEDEDYEIIEIKDYADSKLSSQLRADLKEIGLKSARTKIELITTWTMINDNLQSHSIAGKKIEIFERLTELIFHDDYLLEKVYTFKPLTLQELRARIESRDKIIRLLDDATIKQWADNECICLLG